MKHIYLFRTTDWGCRTSTDLTLLMTRSSEAFTIHYRSNIIKPEFNVCNESMVYYKITQLLLMNEGNLSTAGLTAAPAAAGNQLQLVCCLECNPCAARSPTNWCGEKAKWCFGGRASSSLKAKQFYLFSNVSL